MCPQSEYALFVSESDKPKDPNATIQLSQVDADVILSKEDAPAASHRPTPPPLPVSASLPPAPAAAPQQGRGSIAARIGMIAALVAFAILAGLLVGRRASVPAPTAARTPERSDTATVARAPAGANATAVSSSLPASPSASASSETLVLPVIEMR